MPLLPYALIELGYLHPSKRHKPSAIEAAIEQLKTDLWRFGVIADGDLTRIKRTSGSHASAIEERRVIEPAPQFATIGDDASALLAVG